MCRSSIADNAATGSRIERYEGDSSVYQKWAGSIRGRLTESQGGASVPAEQAAAKVINVIESALLDTRRSPSWFLVGGNALMYWFLGVIQKTLSWPVNGLLARRYELTASD